ncbi:hypothetical protein YPPY04_0501 [Yersinia pestis PY-04]|nr:hypothetical protein YPPY04_0501 [Yersinia pestis PY-04]
MPDIFLFSIFLMNKIRNLLCIKIKMPWQSSAKKSTSDRHNVSI